MKPWMALFDKLKVWAGCGLAAAAICWAAAYTSQAGDELERTYQLFFGTSVVDTLEQASPWIPVQGANRVLIRTVSARSTAVGGFDTTDPDTLFSDSLSAFNVLFSDSVSFIARDSAGTIVSGPNLLTRSGEAPNLLHVFPMCTDSLMLTGTTSRTDTLTKMVGFYHPPINKILRPAANGSGVWTVVIATAPGSVSTYGDGSISAGYMRIRYTALRRSTVQTWSATAPNRVRGTKRLRMYATVIYKNK